MTNQEQAQKLIRIQGVLFHFSNLIKHCELDIRKILVDVESDFESTKNNETEFSNIKIRTLRELESLSNTLKSEGKGLQQRIDYYQRCLTEG